MSIHPTAIISESARLAEDIQIGPYSIIGDDVEIDTGCRIDSHAVINGPTRIGKDNHIYQYCSVGDDPQDKKYRGEPTKLEIGDGNTIREFCTISRGTTQDEGVREAATQILRDIYGGKVDDGESEPTEKTKS